jgi:hypothetical protein
MRTNIVGTHWLWLEPRRHHHRHAARPRVHGKSVRGGMEERRGRKIHAGRIRLKGVIHRRLKWHRFATLGGGQQRAQDALR